METHMPCSKAGHHHQWEPIFFQNSLKGGLYIATRQWKKKQNDRFGEGTEVEDMILTLTLF